MSHAAAPSADDDTGLPAMGLSLADAASEKP